MTTGQDSELPILQLTIILPITLSLPVVLIIWKCVLRLTRKPDKSDEEADTDVEQDDNLADNLLDHLLKEIENTQDDHEMIDHES